jgi:putative flippase GtrA
MKFFIFLREWILENKKDIYYWLLTGFFMFFITTFILYIFVEYLFIRLSIATFLSAEISIILRFYINHKIIFNSNKNILSSLINFHIASALALLIWWGSTNWLALIGVYYIYASIISLVLTTIVNFLSNFFWVWKKK